jgi:putative membrane protein insertion efficiency factor
MKKIILKSLKLYKLLFSPLAYKLLGHGCRFNPSCSEYSYLAIEKHGLRRGMELSFKRVTSCHPLSKKPFLDPVPEKVTS